MPKHGKKWKRVFLHSQINAYTPPNAFSMTLLLGVVARTSHMVILKNLRYKDLFRQVTLCVILVILWVKLRCLKGPVRPLTYSA